MRISIISLSIYFVTWIPLSTIAITEMMKASLVFVTAGDGVLFQVGVRFSMEGAYLRIFCVLFTGLNSAMMYVSKFTNIRYG